MPVLLIAGTGTDVGKTYVTAALIRALKEAAVPIEVLKPVVSGFDPDNPAGSDPAVLLEALGVPLSARTLAAMSPWRYRAPLSPPLAASREGAHLDGAAVIEFCQTHAKAVSPDAWLLVETAGGIMSPLDDHRTMLDLAVALRAPVVLVAGSYLGTISHTLTAAAVIAAANLPLASVVLSESPGANPPMEETAAAMAGRLAPLPIVCLKRNAEMLRDALDRLGLSRSGS